VSNYTALPRPCANSPGKIEGFLAHSNAVAEFYKQRRDIFEAAARKHLDGLAKWVSPVAGMFLWIDMSPAGITDSWSLIRNEALAKGVLAVPGSAFYPSGRASPHVRVSFSILDLEEEAPEGFRRLAVAIRDKRKELGLE
jgi:tryptophan aminotransferase